MSKNITDRFLESIYDFSKLDIPSSVIKEAKICLLDYMACVYAGSNINPSYEAIKKESGNVSIIGQNIKTSILNAALINGINSHTLELDDGNRVAMMHPGSVVISSLISYAQSLDNIKWGDFIKGIVIGYEVSIRLASSIQPSHKLKGFHGTGTCGTIGAAISLCVMNNVDFKYWKAILSAACTSASGILEMIDDSSTLKPYNIGQAALNGCASYMVGLNNAIGPDDPLGGKRGFLKTHTDEFNESYLINGFDSKYAIELIYRKPYAACRHCHAAIEGALLLRDKVDIKAIECIDILTYGLAVKGHEHKEILGVSSAKMSIPYSVASAMILGNSNIEAFSEEKVNDKEILELTNKVDVNESIELSKLVPNKRAAILKIKSSGKEYEVRVDYPKGEPENPITFDEMKEKYFSLMTNAGISKENTQKIFEYVMDIENHFDELMKYI